LVGRALTPAGNYVFALFLAISAYFMYNNYVANPEFYKSLKLSRDADERDSQQEKSE
jgi:hypothetical protein